MRFVRFVLLLIFVLASKVSFAQDIDLYLTDHYLAGKSVIKLSRDFDDPYMWILTRNNEIYRLNTVSKQLDNFTAQFQSIAGSNIFDIAGIGPDWVTLAIKNANGTDLVNYKSGIISYPFINTFNQIDGNITSIGASSIYTEIVQGDVAHPVLLIATDKGFWRYSMAYDVLIHNSFSASQVYSATYRTQLCAINNVADTSGTNLTSVMGTSAGSNFDQAGVIRTSAQFGSSINTAYHTINANFNSSFYFTPDIFWGNETGMYQAKLRNFSPFLSPYKQYLNNIKVNKITDIFGLVAFGASATKENLLVGTDNGLYYSNSLVKQAPDNNLDNFTLYHFDQLGNMPVNFVEVNFKSKIPPFCEDGICCATNDGI